MSPRSGKLSQTSSKANTEASEDMPALKKDGLISIVDKIKLNLLKEGYWDKEITSDLEKIDSNDSLFDAVLLTYNAICVKRNQDKFLTEFYELIPHHLPSSSA